MYTRKFIKSLDVLPNNSKICIYGSGETGISLRDFIFKTRKDVKLAYFIDSFKKGIKDGVEIIKPDELKTNDSKFDIIIVASLFWIQIENTLIQYEMQEKTFIVSNYLIYTLSALKDLNEFHYSEQELKEDAGSKIEFVKNQVIDKEDRELYQCLINFRIVDKEDQYPPEFLSHVSNHSLEYLQFINKNIIENVIEGGVFDGSDTVRFVNELKNPKLAIYGFEPFIEVYNKSLHKKILEKKKVHVYDYALWKSTEKLHFKCVTDNPSTSSVSNQTKCESSIEVQAISGDDFVKKYNIRRVDFIKMDIEGAELDALHGFEKTIIKDLPQMAISIYHNKTHLYAIPLYLKKLSDQYIFRLGQYNASFIDSVLYALPKNRI